MRSQNILIKSGFWNLSLLFGKGAFGYTEHRAETQFVSCPPHFLHVDQIKVCNPIYVYVVFFFFLTATQFKVLFFVSLASLWSWTNN